MMIEMNYNEFYEKYPRIGMTLVREEDISPLIGMLRAFSKVQNREITVEKANESITNAQDASLTIYSIGINQTRCQAVAIGQHKWEQRSTPTLLTSLPN